LLDLKEKTTKC